LSEAVQRLLKVLTLERSRRFADTTVIGGLDAYLRNFLAVSALPPEHRFQELLRSLPPGGYRALHPVQRERVIEELEKALSGPLPPPAPSRPASARTSKAVPPPAGAPRKANSSSPAT